MNGLDQVSTLKGIGGIVDVVSFRPDSAPAMSSWPIVGRESIGSWCHSGVGPRLHTGAWMGRRKSGSGDGSAAVGLVGTEKLERCCFTFSSAWSLYALVSVFWTFASRRAGAATVKGVSSERFTHSVRGISTGI